MPREWRPDLEFEPLAFPIKPRKGEAYDSWIGRLTSKHEVTRAQLFAHLKCNPKLASRDLARGWQTFSSKTEWGDFGTLVASLADAVRVRDDHIEGMFVPSPIEALLPPAMRKFACAACWQSSLTDGEPLIIKREWILRASWTCREHNLPLAWLLGSIDDRNPRLAQNMLVRQIDAARRLKERIAVPRAMHQRNTGLLDRLLDKPKASILRGDLGYQQRMMANPFHLSRARIALLMAAHGDRRHVAERFEAFIDLTVPRLHKHGQGILNPKIRRRAKVRPRVPEGLDVVTHRTWQSDRYDLISAYGSILAKGSEGSDQYQPYRICPEKQDRTLAGFGLLRHPVCISEL